MNPSNPFGSPQGGAFQSTSGAMKTGLFQSFGQQNPGGPPPTMGFFPPSAFAQPPGLSQSSPRGNSSIFGQQPSFGQPSTQAPSLPSQAPAFGQPPAPMSGSGFGGGGAPAFGQMGGPSQTSMFGQTPAFGQPSAFGQAPGFGQQPPGFGKQPPAYGEQQSGFGSAQMASGSAVAAAAAALGQPQPLGFGRSAFGQPSSTSAASGVFGATQTQSRGFGSEFSFKPANEALFKPIFSASPEPANPQTTSMSTSPFGSGSSAQTSSSANAAAPAAASGFSLLTGAKSGPLGFSFSQPAAAPSVSAQKAPLTTGAGGSSSSPPAGLQFTFSQPAALSSSNVKPATTQPTTPSTFSFSTKALLPQSKPLFGGTGAGQPSAFGEIKTKVELNAENNESLGDTNVFARFGKATKRKEDPAGAAAAGPESAAEDGKPGDLPRQPPKRPLMRTRGPPGGIFGRALSGLRRDVTNPAKRDAKRQEAPELEEAEAGDGRAQEEHAPAPQTAAAEPQEKPEQPDAAKAPEVKLDLATPERGGGGVRRESSDSLGGMSPADCTVIQCRNVPPALNKKDTIEKHFARFGKVRKVFCRPGKNLAIVHFDDHASAAKAKKRGKFLQRKELLLLWQRKKQSPGDRGGRGSVGSQEPEAGSQEDKPGSSPLRRMPVRAPPVSVSAAFGSSSPAKKSSLVKSLQFDSEPQPEGVLEAQSSEHAVPASLLPLIGQLAETAEDKYRLLEQRDKLLRQSRPKRTDLNLSKAFAGTCPDMCPEKERYMRETRNQLSVYEVVPNTEMVDHAAAIKEYSRSSADQEEPLPHDLRPLPVLSMTMDYLVTQIMDQGHDSYRDWYDFVWNRTRGIRKDITQQRLCCPLTVALIEKCTRFHVHCAHHLCEEQMSAFDAKINNENMTKCLQSLKEMYEDLSTRAVYCPQEAEFRQYSVLLKLNDGDILREVQQFRDEVRNSAEVKFAVQAFAAVNSNNFVRFFKLVKGASYLASCLLHRYFNQVRTKALKTLNIALTVGPRSTAFPVDDIVRMLMFRNVAEASDLIQQYGLNVSDGVVELSRMAYQEPELPLSQKKSEIILAKRTVLIGQVVNGGALPNPPQHTPVCSFDSQSKYRGEGPLAEPTPSQLRDVAGRMEAKAPPAAEVAPADVPAVFKLPPAVLDEAGEPVPPHLSPPDAQQLFPPVAQPQPVRPPSPAAALPQPVYSDEDIMAEVDSVVDELVDAAVREVAAAGAGYASAALSESGAQAESLLSEVLGQMLKDMSAAEIHLEQERVAEEKRKLEEARRRQEHMAFLVQFGFSLCTEIIHEVLDQSIKETAAAAIQQAAQEKAQQVAECTRQVCSALLEETLSADIALLVEEILDAELQRIHKYIKRWRDVVAVRRQLKRQMRGFPASPCCVDPRFKLKALAPSAPAQASREDLARGLVNLGNAGMLALSSTRLLKMRQEAVHQMRVHYFYQQLLHDMVWTALDLPALVTGNLPSPPDRIFWKAVLLLPSDHESVASPGDRILSDWLEVKLGGSSRSEVAEEHPNGALQTLCVSNTLQENGQRTHKVHVSVKASRGPLSEDGLSKAEELGELQGAAALIMLLPAARAGQDEQDVPLLSALLQLKQLQQVGAWHCPLPLVMLVPGPASATEKLEDALMLQALVTEGLLSEYSFLFIPETTGDAQGSRQLSLALRWLLARAPPPFHLCCQTLVQLVESSLGREFAPRVFAHRQERAAAGLPPQDPAPIVQLYNAVLTHVADAASSQDLSRLSWPPGEFSLPETHQFVPHLAWNSAAHLGWLRGAVLSLQLPPRLQPSATDSWPQLCAAIFDYAAQIPVSRCSQPLLVSRLENLLERVRLRASRTRTPAPRVEEAARRACSPIPWDEVLEICIDHKLKDWQIPGPPTCGDAVTEDGEILVYFLAGSLKGFQPPDGWSEAVRDTHRQKQRQSGGTGAAAGAPPSTASLRQRLFHGGAEPLETPPAPLDVSHTPTAEELLAHRVLQNLEEEKAESRRSLEQLQRWLHGGAPDVWSTSLFLPSSTLLSMPTTVRHAPSTRRREASLTEEAEPEEQPARATRAERGAARVSMSRQLSDLQLQIAASREEELACELKLSGMLSIVDD